MQATWPESTATHQPSVVKPEDKHCPEWMHPVRLQQGETELLLCCCSLYFICVFPSLTYCPIHPFCRGSVLGKGILQERQTTVNVMEIQSVTGCVLDLAS